jgi:hypothetical protein
MGRRALARVLTLKVEPEVGTFSLFVDDCVIAILEGALDVELGLVRRGSNAIGLDGRLVVISG